MATLVLDGRLIGCQRSNDVTGRGGLHLILRAVGRVRGGTLESDLAVLLIEALQGRSQQRAIGIADVDRDLDREPDAQRLVRRWRLIEYDLDRHALDDLNPVASRVLRWEQGEGGAG